MRVSNYNDTFSIKRAKNLSLENIVEEIDGVIYEEEWRPISFNPERYMVSSFGRVKALSWEKQIPHLRNNPIVVMGEKIRRQTSFRGIYWKTHLRKNGVYKIFPTHQLVAKEFCENVNNKPIVNHLDCYPSNNFYKNLQWCTQSENIKYAYDVGRKKAPPVMYERRYGKNNDSAKQVVQMNLNGEFIKEWECVSYIQRDLGFCRPNICKCCRGKIKTAYGYLWRYKNAI